MENKQNKSAGEQWRMEANPPEPNPDNDKRPQGTLKAPLISPSIQLKDVATADAMRRRGFFEAISTVGDPMDKLKQLLDEYRREAERQMMDADAQAAVHIDHLKENIVLSREKIDKLREQLKVIADYREKDDDELQALILEMKAEEEKLQELQDKLTAVRVKLGEAKSQIIDVSLDKAERQVKKALDLEKTMYNDAYEINKRKYHDEKDYLIQLAKCYQNLYDHYEKRHHEIKKHLNVLDVDGISPVTSQVLTTAGSLSFAAAGFFFSVFTGTVTFGSNDIFNSLLKGLTITISTPIQLWAKVGILLGLILLITVVSFACNKLIDKTRKEHLDKDEKLLNDLKLAVATAQKNDDFEYKASLRSNNWYVFWLQIIPIVLMTGLFLIAAALQLWSDLDSISSGAEGVIFGSFIAMSLAGIIYLYIIKIVEPRLLKIQSDNTKGAVNWVKANRELCLVLASFLLCVLCVIVVPIITSQNIIFLPLGHKASYAILLFTGISLVGGISFAYGIRSRGLIETANYLENIQLLLTHRISMCSAPQTPDVYTEVSPGQGSLVQNVLSHFSFSATINNRATTIQKPKKDNEQNSFQRFIDYLIGNSKKEEDARENSPVQAVTMMEPWEEKYFPHIVDELKAVEFEYRERKTKVQKATDAVSDYRTAKATEKNQRESELNRLEKSIEDDKKEVENAVKNSAAMHTEAALKYAITENNIRDGFHLGIWYRENDIGPCEGYYANPPHAPHPPVINNQLTHTSVQS
jgi:predicted  nucleic acid-binding Zn-ribbon protein